jgi:(S)-2-hydroxyglutarate dehydrogenase
VPPAYDLVVVGGGIVGAATALALLDGRRLKLAVLEAEEGLARHQSGRNSGVLHSGIYYRPGSLKARTCTAGREAMERFCAEEGIPFRRCGKLVVATGEAELAALAELERRGRANGLAGLERLGPEEIRRVEPAAVGVAGLWVPQTGVVDFAAVTRALAGRVVAAGGEVRLGVRVRGVRVAGVRAAGGRGGLALATSAGEIACGHLVGCAGLGSDRLARRSGLDPGLRILPFRGDYYELVPERRELVRGLIYPVPDPGLPFLGVHFTRTIDGRVEAGPNAVPALARERYGRFSVVPRDAWEVVSYPGSWRLARRYWRTGLAEIGRSLSRRAFARALARLVPAVTAADVERAGCGVRAQAVDREGRLVDDFLLLEGEGSLHVVNAPSPAATAALAIGRTVAERAATLFGL